jgi:hypothetical protein
MNQKLIRKAMTAWGLKEIYDLNPRTMANLRSLKRGPIYYKRGRKVYYFIEDVENSLQHFL